jgi:hypothetical protein
VQNKSTKVATVLEILAEDAPEDSKVTLNTLSKLVQLKELARAELVQRINALCIEPLTAYPTFCDKLLVSIRS